MSANGQKLTTKRKTISRKGANLNPKRKAIRTVEDGTNIATTKKSKISKHVDLETAPHIFISSEKRLIKIKEHGQLNIRTDSESEIHRTDKNKDGRLLKYVFCDDGVNNHCKKSISGDNVVGSEVKIYDDISLSGYSSLKSATSIFQNEKENDQPIREKENNIHRLEFSGERNEGEQLLTLDVAVLNSPILSPRTNVTRFADNESNSNVTMSSLDEYRANDSQLDSNEESSYESLEGFEVEQDAETTLKVDIKDLINSDNTIWEEVLEKYKRDGIISKKSRKNIIYAIVQYAVFKKIFLDDDAMADISSQICQIFPTETTAGYFVKVGKKPTGKLYNLFHSKRKEFMKEERERAKKPEETLLEPTEAIDFLKNDGEEDDDYIQKWRETFVYRQKKILKYESYDDFMNEWPIIEKPIGPLLINIDFEQIYKKRSLTSHNWNLFFSNNWTSITRNINEKGIRFCKKVYKLKESPSKDAALSLVLHYLLPPAYVAFQWKPTYVDSQNTFLKFIKDECMETEIENRNKVCTLRGIKWHPYIIGQGSSQRKIKHFYVVIHNTKIKADNFLSALDLCMKLFIVLNIPYPPESRAVWILVNKIFYNIKVDPLMTSRIFQLLHDLN